MACAGAEDARWRVTVDAAGNDGVQFDDDESVLASVQVLLMFGYGVTVWRRREDSAWLQHKHLQPSLPDSAPAT